jgi:hypothetical protein
MTNLKNWCATRAPLEYFCFDKENAIKAKVGSTPAKAAALRVNPNLVGAPVTSRTHTHLSHSQTFRLVY